MKVLVTGGAGYIGSHAVRLLQERGHSVVVVDNLSYGHRSIVESTLRVPLYIVDIGNKEQIKNILQKENIEAVMHFSAYALVGESVTHPAKYYENNVQQTLNLLEVMRECGVLKIIFSSTCATYGVPAEIPICEICPQFPINPYGSSKLMVEQILRDFDAAYGMKFVSFRYFNAAGAHPLGDLGEAHSPETHLIPLILDAAAGRREDIKVFGQNYETPDGTCVRDYIHVMDIAEAHLLGLEYLANGGTSDFFNLGNGTGFSVLEVIEMAKKVSGKEFKVSMAARREGDPPVLVGSSDKVRRVLAWKPQFENLEKIMSDAWNWYHKGKAKLET